MEQDQHSNANSQGNNHIAVTHKLAVQLEVQPHCFSEECVGFFQFEDGR